MDVEYSPLIDREEFQSVWDRHYSLCGPGFMDKIRERMYSADLTQEEVVEFVWSLSVKPPHRSDEWNRLSAKYLVELLEKNRMGWAGDLARAVSIALRYGYLSDVNLLLSILFPCEGYSVEEYERLCGPHVKAAMERKGALGILNWHTGFSNTYETIYFLTRLHARGIPPESVVKEFRELVSYNLNRLFRERFAKCMTKNLGVTVLMPNVEVNTTTHLGVTTLLPAIGANRTMVPVDQEVVSLVRDDSVNQELHRRLDSINYYLKMRFDAEGVLNDPSTQTQHDMTLHICRFYLYRGLSSGNYTIRLSATNVPNFSVYYDEKHEESEIERSAPTVGCNENDFSSLISVMSAAGCEIPSGILKRYPTAWVAKSPLLHPCDTPPAGLREVLLW